MSVTIPVAKRVVVGGLLVCLLPVLSGCTWQGYVVARGVRTATGTRAQVHPIVPVTSTLRTYRVIETHALENLVPGMPSELEQYLNDALAQQLSQVESSPTIVRSDPDSASSDALATDAPAVPTLAFEGVIDDYDPGYASLRLVELGLNHLVVTVRINLHDKQTGQTVAAASVTVEDNRVTATSKEMINRLAYHVRTFVEAGYAK